MHLNNHNYRNQVNTSLKGEGRGEVEIEGGEEGGRGEEAKNKNDQDIERPRFIMWSHFLPLNIEKDRPFSAWHKTVILSDHDAGPIALLFLN